MPSLTDYDPSKPLDNPRHEKFARLVAGGGKSDVECYQLALGATYESAKSNAWSLRENQGIAARIRMLVEAISSKAVLTLQEKRRFLRDVVLTPPSEINEDSPLCQGVKRDRETGLVTEVKVPDKLGALKLDAELAGELDGPKDRASMSFTLNLQLGGCPDQLMPEVIDIESETMKPAKLDE